MKKELLYSRSRIPLIIESEYSDVKHYGQLSKCIPVPLIDRCQHIVSPLNYKVFDNKSCVMPKDLSNFNLTYEDCSEYRVNEILEIARKLDKSITILYSGGIDSTYVVISFLKFMSKEEFKERVRVALSMDSIQENPNFYYDHIRPNATIISSEPIEAFYDKTTICVSGEHNDQLFGSDLMTKIWRRGNEWNRMSESYSRDFIVDRFFSKVLDYRKSSFPDTAYQHFYFDIIDEQIKVACPIEIKTNYDWFWWFNFSFKWQSVYFRMLMTIAPETMQFIDDDFFNNYYIHFFSSQNFQKWSMTNPGLKIRDNDWRKYKWECRRLIYEYNKDEEFFKEKFKIGSLLNLYMCRKAPDAITTDFEFINFTSIDEIYVPDNTYKRFGQ